MPEVAELDVTRGERGMERWDAARRAAVEEREAVHRLDEVGANPSAVATVQEVERLVRHVRTVDGW